jgi:hypothetical protein
MARQNAKNHKKGSAAEETVYGAPDPCRTTDLKKRADNYRRD